METMIWIRRGFAIPLIILFVPLLLASLSLTQVNSTFGNSDSYNSQTHKADMYDFVYDEALPAALDEIEAQNAPQDIPVHLSKVKAVTVTTAREILPPKWLEAQFESAVHTFLPYFLGSTDEFTYTLITKDRAETAAKIIKEDFLQGETFRIIYNDGISYLAGKLAENLDQLPYSIALSKDHISSSIQIAAPPDWLIYQIGPAIDSVTPYMTGDSDHFTAKFEVADRVDVAAAAIIDLFGRQETYQY
ncbi:MAG: hypothetical protein PHV74_08080, partial [Dehalococcoidia bacterium]|nr:hypothetical protein [Dehalococcoidia bacterium]